MGHDAMIEFDAQGKATMTVSVADILGSSPPARKRSRPVPPQEAPVEPPAPDPDAPPPVRHRSRTGAPARPPSWPNGSACFAAGTLRKVPAWATPDEALPGFLGRMVPDGSNNQGGFRYRVFKWTAGAYIDAGTADNNLDGLALLHGKTSRA
jgi:hypothetical protein